MKNAAFILFCFLFLSAYSIGQELYPYRDSGGKYGYKEKNYLKNQLNYMRLLVNFLKQEPVTD